MEPAARLGLGEDVVAMTVLGKMEPAEREQLGIRPVRVVINTCPKARQLAADYQAKRDALAARLAAAASAPPP
jgi:anti-sigma factor RsiW